jgi:ElaB/YqjD/DUF883 family membrane-anchored ribosome-binding protein
MANSTESGFEGAGTFSENVEGGFEDMKEKTTEAAVNAVEKGRKLGRSAVDTIEQGRRAAASSLQNAASTLHDRADHLPGVEKAGSVAHSTADKLEAVAGYMRDHDTKQMMADVEDVVKRRPGQSLLVAVALGFFIGKVFSKD